MVNENKDELDLSNYETTFDVENVIVVDTSDLDK